MPTRPIDPPLAHSFSTVFELILAQPSARTIVLHTTGDPGTDFVAEARYRRRARVPYIQLPHSNRIYEKDWGFSTNSMGKTGEGQRIGQYAKPIDEWASRVLAGR